MAMAARRERGLLDPDAAPGTSPFDHFIYAFASDGDIEEGITHEVSSLAAAPGTRQPDRALRRQPHLDRGRHAHRQVRGRRRPVRGLRLARAAASSWRTADGYHENVQALYDAFEAAKAVTDKPSFIVLRTIIGWPAPNKQNTGAAHGSALGEDEVAATKKILGFDPAVNFPVEEEAVNRARRGRRARQGAARGVGRSGFAAWAAANPERKALFDRLAAREPPGRLGGRAARRSPPTPKGVATRRASGKVLTALAPVLPELWGGSADLAESNLTTMEGEPSFVPADHQTKMWPGNPYGRTLHFGIREHGMGVDPERHRAARPHPAVRRHVPAVQRLHAAARSGWPR